MKTYPVCLVHLERRTAVVVGGGEVAERKVAGLLEAGACVTVICPTQTAQLLAWANARTITLIAREYRYGDLAGAFLVVAATDDPMVNQAVCDESGERGCLVNSAEHPERSDFILPAVVRRGQIAVAVSTGGASPALARHLRDRVGHVVGAEYADAAGLLDDLRPALIERFPGAKARSAAVDYLLGSGLLDYLAREGREAAAEYALAMIDANHACHRSPQEGEDDAPPSSSLDQGRGI
jgi:precorrin-2 dehydrogenase/sirohydrochlorin ferrochelatase